MHQYFRPWGALVLLCASTQAPAAIVSQTVVDYHPGINFAVEFGSGLGYTNTQVVLGEPNRDTSYGGVTPFNPPFARSELLSIGEGGSLVVELDFDIWNNPDHPFGIDFIIYGSAGFLDVDYPNAMTDGMASMFGQNLGQTRIWVSQDNVDFHMLDPTRAPVADGLFPTDGAGEFGRAVNPSLTPQDLANLNLGQLRGLYDGAAGGTGYDLGWALDGTGQTVDPGLVRYVRVDVLSGRAEVDAILGVTPVPEPGVSLLAVLGLAASAWSWRARRRDSQ